MDSMTAKAWTYRYRAQATGIDGDTLHATLDLGLRLTATVPVRLAGCNAAEHGTPSGDAATAFTADWLTRNADPDGWVAVVTHRDPRDNYGRWQAEVQSLDGLHSLVDDLIAAGLAMEWDGRGAAPVPPWPAVPVAAG